ncbi:MAG: N-acetylmuramoyl-L-alanine amidase [Vicinamibacterales bacterium]
MPPPSRRAVAAVLVLAAAGLVEAKPGGHPRRRPVDAVIVHSLGGPDCADGRRFYRTVEGDAASWMATFNRLPIVSIHYVIGRDGQVAAGVPEAVAAAHATGWNQRSIGIELVNNGDGVDPFPAVQVEALVTLVRGILARHPDVTPARILRHSDVDRSTFPEAAFGRACTAFRRKEDPGAAFPWEAFEAAVAAPRP